MINRLLHFRDKLRAKLINQLRISLEALDFKLLKF